MSLRRPALIEHGKNALYLSNMTWSDSLRPSTVVERPEPPMLERQDHIGSLVCRLSLVDRHNDPRHPYGGQRR